ncbi:MAG TPA: DUF2911 domain-containing protein [Bacteroidota bacterium]
MNNTRITIIALLGLFVTLSVAVAQSLDIPPNGGNKKATVTEAIGITDVTINYHRPGVRGREGKIWGRVVPYGFKYFSFITLKSEQPWRGGANENTTISFEHDVKVEGKDLAAGTYGLHFAVWPDSCIVIFSKSHDAWGSFDYQEKDDALRVVVKPQQSEAPVEWLKYEFIDQTATGATIALMWEKLKIPFKVDVDVDKTVIDRMREQLKGSVGHQYQNWVGAVEYCVEAGKNLEEALYWSERGISGFGGEKNYATLSTRADVLEKLERQAEADSVRKEILKIGTSLQISQYASDLTRRKKFKEALSAAQFNIQRNGEDLSSLVAVARAYSANGDFKKALVHAEKAVPLATNPGTKSWIEGMVAKLKKGENIH